jgi:prepilin-type N-terminal cleavage/methylation domain-containing protein
MFHRKACRFGRTEKGMSALEMLVAVALLGLVVSVIYSFIYTGNVLSRKGQKQADLQQNLRLVALQLSHELRQAKKVLDPQADSIAWRNRSNADVTFRWDSGTGRVIRTEGEQDAVVAEGVAAFALSYSADGRLVTLRIEGGPELGSVRGFEARVYLRNPGSGVGP